MTASKLLLFAVMLFSFVGMPLVAHAQKVDCSKPKLLSIADMGDCASQEYATAENELNKTFHKALAQYTSSALRKKDTRVQRKSADIQMVQWKEKMRDDLNASQEAWLKYRDLACGAVRDMYGLGTSAEINVPECRADLTRARVRFLRTYFLNR